MPYPIITPSYYQDITQEKEGEENVEYNVLTTPYAVEYTFPIYQKRVLRTLMDYKEPLSFKMTNLKPENEKEFADHGAELVKKYPQLKNYWSFKVLTMNVLQDRTYIFEKRMLLLNYVYKTLQDIITKTEGDEREYHITTFSNEYIKATDHSSIIKLFESITPNFAYSLCDGLSLLHSLPPSEEYTKLLDKVFEAAGGNNSTGEFKFDRERYLPVKKAYYDDFLKGREHYIEQVMINYVWTYCMPFADCTSSLWDNFIFFNTLFNTVKVLITCATYNAEDKDAAFMNAIAEFDLALRRTKGSLVKLIAAANAKEGLANNGDMAILAMS